MARTGISRSPDRRGHPRGNLGALRQALGHASIETTQRYARMSDEVVMREAERLAAGMGATMRVGR